jgi:glycosyltransferase involved in cell wall biosynthesis
MCVGRAFDRAMTIYVIVGSFLKPETLERIPGGTETYTDALARLAQRLGGQTVVLQKSNFALEAKITTTTRVLGWLNERDLRNKLTSLRKQDKGVVVMYQEFFRPQAEDSPCVLVQHGIGGDGTADPPSRPGYLLRLADLQRRYRLWRGGMNDFRICTAFDRVICVDTNFINQVRANNPMYDLRDRLTYVPNFADIHPESTVKAKWNGGNGNPFVVLFARRFELHRGVYLWADCVEKLSRKFPDVEFRFVGYGVGETRIRSLQKLAANVKVYAKPYDQMPAEYAAAHISVVPSLWSEGTSLSCIESMAAGCVTVVSNVGGLGNLVIPNYNGLILPPTESAFTEEVGRLLDSRDQLPEPAMRGYEVARRAFSRAQWEDRVGALFNELVSKPEQAQISRRLQPA